MFDFWVYWYIHPISKIPVYTGYTKQLERRHRGHVGGGIKANQRLHQSFNKHGAENFKRILVGPFEKNTAEEFEKWYIAHHRYVYGRENIYNILDGGEGGSGYNHTPEHKIYMSRKMKGENNARFGKPSNNRGKKMTAKARENISKSQMGKKLSEAHKAAIGATLKGYQPSEDLKFARSSGRRRFYIKKRIMTAAMDMLDVNCLFEHPFRKNQKPKIKAIIDNIKPVIFGLDKMRSILHSLIS